MTLDVKPITITTDADFPRILDLAEISASPVLLERRGVLFALQRASAPLGQTEDDSLERTNEVTRILDETLGSWADLEVDRLVADIREARRSGSRHADER